jgi:hypothetical protein
VAAAAVAVALLLLEAATAARDHLGALRARVDARERELRDVRRLAARLAAVPATVPADGASLLALLEAAADGVVGRERIASMTPVAAPAGGGLVGERVGLRVVGASLEEVVHLLHALEGGRAPLAVVRLTLRKHPDDGSRFDLTAEVGRTGAPG